MPIASGDIGLFNESVRGANRVTRSHGEAKFVRQAQKGDVRAFNELVRAYQARAYRLAYRILGDSQMAGDATQEAFLSPFRNFGALRGDSFGSWLVRIVSNACYDQLRKKQR